MRDEEIQRKIASFPRWHYRFDLNGHETPILDELHAVRHEKRKEHFFDPLVDLMGGSLSGKRVLDLGCNAGYWSLRAVEAGCDYVLGIDGRQMHVEQADFVFEVKGVEKSRYDFVAANVFDLDLLSSGFGAFDVVLCLGLLYHVSKPMELMEEISSVNTDVLVVDTSLSTLPGSLLELRRDRLDEPRHAVDYELVMVPTKEAVCDLVRQFGYTVITLAPPFLHRKGVADYLRGARRAFLCTKRTDLSALAGLAEEGP